MNWANRELEREREQEQANRWHAEKAVREARIKDQLGPALFESIRTYIAAQVAKYNDGKKATSSRLVYEIDVPTLIGFDSKQRNLRVKRADGSLKPLVLMYSPTTHIVEWECGASKGSFHLRLTEENRAYFETPHHIAMSAEEMGDDLLSRFSTPR